MPPNDEFQSTLDDKVSLEPLLDEIKQQHGPALLAILVYGSWLRGKRDTMLDFYVLVEDYTTLGSRWQGWMCRLIPPNVYHIQRGDLHAKYALLTLDRFCHNMQHGFHSYFWARFAQPCEVLYVRDTTSRTSLQNAFRTAAGTFVRYVVPSLPDEFTSRQLWTHGLAQTYRCELRTESSNRAESLYDFNPGWYDDLSHTLAGSKDCMSATSQKDVYCNQCSKFSRAFSTFSWWLRRVQGRLLSLLRLGKAAFTFNEPLQYLLWKVERHTGIYIEPSDRQLKHPLIFAWPLLWKLHRQGAFR